MKCLFVVQNFICGGVTTSLMNFANELIKKKHDVTILSLENNNEQLLNIDDKVKIVFLNLKAHLCFINLTNIMKNKNPIDLYYWLRKKSSKNLFEWLNYIWKKEKTQENYDVVFAYIHSEFVYYYTLYCVNAKWHLFITSYAVWILPD